VSPEATARFAVSLDPSVNGLTAHAEDALKLGASDDLLGAEMFTQKRLDAPVMLWAISAIAAGAAATAASLLASWTGAINPIVVGAVANDLAKDGAAVAAKDLGDMVAGTILDSQLSNGESLFLG
jgi:hypothetical protein